MDQLRQEAVSPPYCWTPGMLNASNLKSENQTKPQTEPAEYGRSGAGTSVQTCSPLPPARAEISR